MSRTKKSEAERAASRFIGAIHEVLRGIPANESGALRELIQRRPLDLEAIRHELTRLEESQARRSGSIVLDLFIAPEVKSQLLDLQRRLPGVRPDENQIDWSAIFNYLSGRFGWLPEQISRLTLAQVATYLQASPPMTASTQENSRLGGRTTRKTAKGKNVNGRMLANIQRIPDALYWSCRKWAEHLGCSHSSVKETLTWQQCLEAAEESRRSRALRLREDP